MEKKLNKALDAIDIKILNELQRNGKISNIDLSKKVGLSPTPCLERVKRLEKQGVIMDGRDIGTVVLPNADYKFFLTASADERARRRFLELQSLGIETTIEEVKQNLIERDRIDSERDISPLKQAEDAILIDNTNLNKEETIDLILSYIKK